MRATRATRALSLLLTLSVSVSPLRAQEPAQPPGAVAAFRAGQEAFQHEEFDAAIAQFKSAIALDPRFAAAHCALGQTYMTTRRYAEAVEALVQCKAASERQAAAQSQARGEQERAIDREIVELRDSINLIRGGTVKTADENTVLRLEERMRKLEQERNRGAAARSGVSPAILLALGTAYLRVGALDAAERELKEAVKQQPSFGDAHNNLAVVYVGLSRWEEAAKEVQLAEAAGRPVSPALKADIAARRSSAASASAGPTGAAASAASSASPSATTSTAPAVEPPPAIDHVPVACVAADSFPRVQARVTPGNATAKVFFRTDASVGWFAVRLHSDDERFAALLPRPKSARSFRYYIEATGEDTRTTRTPEYVTSVVDQPRACAGQASDSMATARAIVVEPPATAKAHLVPPGFSTRGTVGDVGQFEMGTKVAVGLGILVAGAAVAGAVAAAGKSVSVPTTTFVAQPEIGGDIALVSTAPGAGGTVSISQTPLAVTLRAVSPFSVSSGPARVQFARTATGGSFFASCATLLGTHPDFHPGETVTMTVTGLLTNDHNCGDQFDAHGMHVVLLEAAGPQVLQTGTGFIPDIVISLSFVP